MRKLARYLRIARHSAVPEETARERGKLRQAIVARDLHEASCAGYKIDIDETDRTVEVFSCETEFDAGNQKLSCRHGASKQAHDIEKAELATRGPDWKSRSQFHYEELDKQYREMKVAP